MKKKMQFHHWLLTSTTYGTWLPGDERGFVSPVLENGRWILHNTPNTPVAKDIGALKTYAMNKMKGNPVYLTKTQAESLLEQFEETAVFRKWSLLAVAVMSNHFHLVVQSPAGTDAHKMLGDFKSYGSRKLNRSFSRPDSETWWTSSGSIRPLKTDAAVKAAVNYVKNQHHPLVVWIHKNHRAGDVSPRESTSGITLP